MLTSAFDADTALEPLGGGRFGAHVPEHWFVATGPNGGFIAALVTHAMEAMVDVPPRSLTIHYLAPPKAGPVVVYAQVTRAGRTTSFLRLDVEQDGELVSSALGVCAPFREGQPEWTDLVMPSVPPPDECLQLDPARSGVPAFVGNYDMRMLPMREGEAFLGGWLRTPDARPSDAPLLAAMTDAWFPPAFVRVGRRVFVPTLDLTIHFRSPAPEGEHPWVLGTFRSAVAAGGTVEEDGELWSADGRLLAQSRQTAVIRTPRP